MDFINLLKDKKLKSKEKTEQLANGLILGAILIEDLIKHAALAKDAEKATCIEAFEFATKQKPEIGTEKLLAFVTENLVSKAPRVKWESAKVVANIAHEFPKKLDKAIVNLLNNTNDKGTVVRWSAAMALCAIVKIKTAHNKELIPLLNTKVLIEPKNSIRKIYLVAINSV